MQIVEGNFKWHLEAFASEVFINIKKTNKNNMRVSWSCKVTEEYL